MKVILVNTNKAWGGGEKWHLDSAITLSRKGFNVTILASGKNELYKRSVSAGIPVISLNIGNLSFLNPFRLNTIRKIFKQKQPDMVILNLSSDLKTAGIAARIAGVKHIIYRRGNARPVKNSLTNRILFRKVVTSVIVNSQETRRAILKYNEQLFPALKINVIYNGINLKHYDNLAFHRIFRATGGHVILGSAGRLSNEKGQGLLIDLATKLRKRQILFTMIIAGEGPMKEILKEKCREAGLESQVMFVGFMKNIKSLMESIDIFILPSLWEGFGYVTTEAMASRKPVVAFRTGSNPEIVEDKKTGFLVSCYDTDEMADRVVDLVNDPGLRDSFGIAGRKRVENVFNSEKTDVAFLQYLVNLNH